MVRYARNNPIQKSKGCCTNEDSIKVKLDLMNKSSYLGKIFFVDTGIQTTKDRLKPKCRCRYVKSCPLHTIVEETDSFNNCANIETVVCDIKHDSKKNRKKWISSNNERRKRDKKMLKRKLKKKNKLEEKRRITVLKNLKEIEASTNEMTKRLKIYKAIINTQIKCTRGTSKSMGTRCTNTIPDLNKYYPVKAKGNSTDLRIPCFRNSSSIYEVEQIPKTKAVNSKSKMLLYISEVYNRDKCTYRARKGIDTNCSMESSIGKHLLPSQKHHGIKKFSASTVCQTTSLECNRRNQCPCAQLKKQYIRYPNYLKYKSRSIHNYHGREGLNIGGLKDYLINNLFGTKVSSMYPKSTSRKRRRFKITTKRKKKRLRNGKLKKRGSKTTEQNNCHKQFKKEQKQFKKESREIAKQDRPYDNHCLIDFLVAACGLAFRGFKGMFNLLFNVITEPKQSFNYMKTRLKHPSDTICRFSKWWSIFWQRQKLAMTRSVRGSKTMSILTDALQGTNAVNPCNKSAFLASLRIKPCLWVYHICPSLYPQFLQFLRFWRCYTDIVLFLLAVLVWSPCIICFELCRCILCCCLWA